MIFNSQRSKETQARSWRLIPQTSKRRTVTPIARKRMLMFYLKATGGIVAVAVMTTSITAAVLYWRSHEVNIALGGPSVPVSGFTFETNGFLDGRWASEHLSLPVGTPIMDVDIYKLRDAALSYGQVESAVVSRLFPDKLGISVKERAPVLRARIPAAGGGTRDVFIAADGTVYHGFNYSVELRRSVPFVDGVRFQRKGGRIVPLEHMEVAAALVKVARTRYPDIYKDWRVVDYSRFDAEPGARTSVLTVRTSGGGEIRFAPGDFEAQLRDLADVFAYNGVRGEKSFRKIDLSYEDPVVLFASGSTAVRRSWGGR